ncbi:MAG: 4'-phosphopantetheinyl transferase superfamily protein [Hyphomonadaceae bacterium]|nr:4'-phosphopantetheinyl transferase superfamily protein [Hyphomonadaceae bacterium]
MAISLLSHLDPRMAGQLMAADLLEGMPPQTDAVLPAQDQMRLDRLADPGRRARLAAALHARRAWLSKHLASLPTQISIELDDHGKPHLQALPQHAVSFSRSEDWSAAALGQQASPLGIDLEAVRQLAWRPMMLMISAPDEAAALMPELKSPTGFFRLWTLKEAVLKAIGRGFGANAKQVRITPTMLRQPGLHKISHDTEGLFLGQWIELEGCVLALALAQRPQSLSRTHIGSTS